MPKRYTNKKKGAILYQYGSKFLHKLLDIESFLVKHTDLTRNRLYIMGGCCLTITGMIRSLFRGKAFTPIAWIINSIFSLSGLLISIFLFIIAVSAVYFIQNHSEEFSDEYDEERNFTKSASGTHGTASFLEGEEIKDVYGLCPEKKLENLNGFLIGKVPDISRNTGHIGDIVSRDEALMQKKFLSNRNTLIISFYAPIEDKILKKIDAMRVGALYSGTILRFLPPTEERKHPYMIVKTDSGVEVLCTLPNWKKPPMEMDSVNVKIVEIRPNGQNTLVLGFIKR